MKTIDNASSKWRNLSYLTILPNFWRMLDQELFMIADMLVWDCLKYHLDFPSNQIQQTHLKTIVFWYINPENIGNILKIFPFYWKYCRAENLL